LRIHKILTSRLAITIYKATTLKLTDTTTKIGTFYRKELGIRSKTIQLPNIKPIQRVKAYDLKLLESSISICNNQNQT
jgi:hypothetical protein